MSKFKPGEIAIYLYDGGGFHASDGPGNLPSHNGAECSIVSGPWNSINGVIGYRIKFAGDNNEYGVRETSLRKKRPPEQPSAFSYDEIISMCNGTDIRPTERQVREGLRGILHPFGEKAGE